MLKLVGGGVLLGIVILSSCLSHQTNGYYRASAWSNLDGSTAYLHLNDGVVDVINVGGQTGSSIKRIGSYQEEGGFVSFQFVDPQTSVQKLRSL